MDPGAILNSDKKFSSFTGVIQEIDLESWNIKFSVPGIIEDLSDYPVANALFSHVRENKKGDEVLIIKPSSLQSEHYYWLPSWMDAFIGMKFGSNIIDLTRDGIIDIYTDKISQKIKDELIINIGAVKLIINKEGNVQLSATTGNFTIKQGSSSIVMTDGSIVSTGGQ